MSTNGAVLVRDCLAYCSKCMGGLCNANVETRRYGKRRRSGERDAKLGQCHAGNLWPWYLDVGVRLLSDRIGVAPIRLFGDAVRATRGYRDGANLPVLGQGETMSNQCALCGHWSEELRQHCGRWRCRNIMNCMVQIYGDSSIVILARRDREENG